MMADQDKLFDQRLHDAYEHIELSAEAQDRMLANLLAAQGRTQVRAAVPEQPAGPVRPADPEPAGAWHEVPAPETPITSQRHRRGGWQRWLPLAAVLAVAFVVVRGLGAETGKRAIVANSVESAAAKGDAVSEELAEETTADGLATTESLDAGGMDAAAEAAEESQDSLMLDADAVAPLTNVDASPDEEEAAPQERALSAVDYYPHIVLEDGTELTALRDALYVDEVAAEQVGEAVGAGTAGSFDSDERAYTVACTVYRLRDDDEAYAVRYEGEDSYWRCTEL